LIKKAFASTAGPGNRTVNLQGIYKILIRMTLIIHIGSGIMPELKNCKISIDKYFLYEIVF